MSNILSHLFHSFFNKISLDKTIPPNVKYADHFVALQRKARESQRGLWGIHPISHEAEGSFVGSYKSNKYHRPDCQWAKKVSKSNIIWFKDRQDARNKGYIPCKVCNP